MARYTVRRATTVGAVAFVLACSAPSSPAVESAESTTTTAGIHAQLAEGAATFNEECVGRIEPGNRTGVPAIAGRDSIDVDLNPIDTTPKCSGLLLDMLIESFGFSDSLRSRVEGTRALDGELSATAPGWTVYWRYHPDNGLDMTLAADMVVADQQVAGTTVPDQPERPYWRTVGEHLAERSPKFADAYDLDPRGIVDSNAPLADQVCEKATGSNSLRAMYDELSFLYQTSDNLQDFFRREYDWLTTAEVLLQWRCPEERDRLFG